MNSASRIVQTSSQWLISTSTATRPGHGAEHEPDGDRQHVDDDDVLERARSTAPAAQGRPPRRRRMAGPARTPRRARTRRARSPTVSAAGTGSAPDAIGRRALSGCWRSLSRSAISLMRYTTPDSRQKIRNAAAARATAVRIEQAQAEQQPRKDQQILRPLAGTQGNQKVQRERTLRAPRATSPREEKCCAPSSAGQTGYGNQVRIACGD